MPNVFASLACNLDADILSASLPLLQESRVEAIEWSFDALFQVKQVPEWFLDLLKTFSKEQRLIGHGVFFSLFSGRWTAEQHQWLTHLSQLSKEFQFDHVTEHFGFMTGQNFHHGAPLNIPFTPTTLAIGQDRLARIQDACQCPVGLENLAFAYSLDQVKQHGEFLEKLIRPINGFIILDLHNLYCQLHNFSVSFEQIIHLYPLEKVREIHISGGSWESSAVQPGRQIRRDTHDQGVPEEVFQLLQRTLPLCPHLTFVTMEQLGSGLKTTQSKKQFYSDFLRMENIIQNWNSNGTVQTVKAPSFLPSSPLSPGPAIEDQDLYEQQMELSQILETAGSYLEAKQQLVTSLLASSAWKVEHWEPCMVETAMSLAQKWKKK